MARPRLGPQRQPWKGIDANERAYNTVHNALVGIILDGVTGVSPDIGHRQIAPEKADEYLDRGRRVLADFESQNPAPGGSRGRGQFWMENKIRELKRLLSDAEAVRSGAKPQKQTPESYGELRKHLGVASPGKNNGVSVGDRVTAEWTWGHQRFQAAGEVAKVSGKTVKVKLTEDAGGHFRPGFIVTTSTEHVHKSGGVREARPSLHKSEGVKIWGIWDAARQNWLPDALRGAVDMRPARYRSKEEAERAAREWRTLNPGNQFEVRKFSEVHESSRAKEGHRVADFNSLDALLRHERDENGAKYAYRSPGSIRIYYPDGKGFKEGVAWKEQGYWHSQAPSERVSVSKPPQGSEAIVGKSLTTKESRADLRWPELSSGLRWSHDGVATGKRGTYRTGKTRNGWTIVLNGHTSLGEWATIDLAKNFANRFDRQQTAAREVPRAGDRRIAHGGKMREDPPPDAEAAGAQYADDQINSDYFLDWVREQLAEAADMDPSEVLPLETQADAMEIAKNMLQQLKWDTSRDLEPREIARLIGVDDTTREDVKEFFKGFRETLDTNRAWLAEELLRLKGEMK